MKAWSAILTGWITFIIGHAILVAVRARLLASYFGSGQPLPISEISLRVIDGVILAAALILMVTGTFALLNKPRWKLLVALLALVIQLFSAYLVYIFLSFTVHIGVGGPL